MSKTRAKWLGKVDLAGSSYIFREIAENVWEAIKLASDGTEYDPYEVRTDSCTCKGYTHHHKECRHMTMLHSLLSEGTAAFDTDRARSIAISVIEALDPFVSRIGVDGYNRDEKGQVVGVKITAKTSTGGSAHLVGKKDGLRIDITLVGRGD